MSVSYNFSKFRIIATKIKFVVFEKELHVIKRNEKKNLLTHVAWLISPFMFYNFYIKKLIHTHIKQSRFAYFIL